MKKWIGYFAAIFVLCFFALEAKAQGKVILDLDQKEEVEIKKEENSFGRQIENVIEIGAFFDQNYPGNEIEENFSDDVEKFFPKLQGKDLFERTKTIRHLIKIYRFTKETYKNIQEKIILPESAPLFFDDSEYEAPYTDPYIESDQLVVVEDFKKVISYGSDPKDIKAMSAKRERDAQKTKNKSNWAKLSESISKLEFKKLPYYGILYDDPFVGKKGLGAWEKDEQTRVRLLASTSAVNNAKEIRGALHFDLNPNNSILAFDGGGYHKIKLSFPSSSNLEKFAMFSPTPVRNIDANGNDIIGYTGNFAVPLIFYVKDPLKHLELNAEVKFSLCNLLECQNLELKPKLLLEEGTGDASSVATFIDTAFANLPQDANKNIKLITLAYEEDNSLRAVFEIDDTPFSFDCFIETKDNAEFNPPKTAINNGMVIVRFEPKNKNASLLGKEFSLIAVLNKTNVIKIKATANEASIFDALQSKLSLGILWLAFLGGLILNLMPCVFPVLSIKMMGFAKFGAKAANAKKDLWLSVLGIFAAFLIISSSLAILKVSGQAVGWGMQFQNAPFLVVMIFVMCFFMAHVMGLIDLSIKVKQKETMPFFSGILAVILATPCTAPYLGTAIGFALAGNVFDIYAVLTSVALGLSLPYIVMCLLPNSIVYLPKPGKWMLTLNRLMILALFLSIVWMLSILAAQTSFGTSIRLSIYTLLFLCVVWARKLLIEQTEISDMDKHIKQKVTKFFKVLSSGILIFIFAVAMADIGYNFNKFQNQKIEARLSRIDYAFIAQNLAEKRPVIVSIEADWCLTCSYNNLAVFNTPAVKNRIEDERLAMIRIDWTNYDAEILEFMERFGRKGLPFYILFTPTVPEGIVLPELLTEKELSQILNSM